MNTMTIEFNNSTQTFIKGLEVYISKFQDVSMNIQEKVSLPSFSKKINISVVDYVNYMIAYEKEKVLVMEDMKTMEEEIIEVNSGTLKLKSAYD